MPTGTFSDPIRKPLPLILIRGFGGLDVEDEKRVAYQGFNDGTVYPQKRGENYIYEGLILRFLKSSWRYQDATNVVGYYGKAVQTQAGDAAEVVGCSNEENVVLWLQLADQASRLLHQLDIMLRLKTVVAGQQAIHLIKEDNRWTVLFRPGKQFFEFLHRCACSTA